MVNLYYHQRMAVDRLRTGSVLKGGVGSGKSITALAYFFEKECEGNLQNLKIHNPKDLYIITIAVKRDRMEWEQECSRFLLTTKKEFDIHGINVKIDSWNNISKYCNVCGAFFIFDEQKASGSGTWVKSFLQITKKNNWIMLSATPGDTWMDYVPLFVANGFYKNRTEFCREHVIYDRWAKYPKINRYVGVEKLESLRNKILVDMPCLKPATSHSKEILVSYDHDLYKTIFIDRWNPYLNEPIINASQFCYLARRVSNSDQSRIEATKKIIDQNPKIIIFYNFDYELEILREISKGFDRHLAEWNGHKHMPIPEKGNWIYLAQYASSAEGWNCIQTDTVLFYSLNYSYRMMEQSAGRIDRLNTPFSDLYYYYIRSNSDIDKSILKALSNKQDFNELNFTKEIGLA